MSFAPDTALLVCDAGQRMRDPGQAVCPPWTRRDIADMRYIDRSLCWLIDEIKSGYGISEETHGRVIESVIALGRALDRKEREYFANKAGSGGGGAYGGRRTFTTPATPKSPQANRAVEKIRKLDRYGADDLHEVMVARAHGRVSPKEANPQLREAADDIEKFLGGKVTPKDYRINPSGDLVVFKGDKKFRMDVKNPGKTKDRKMRDDPHFHFQQMDKNGDWIDASDQHKNYFRKE